MSTPLLAELVFPSREPLLPALGLLLLSAILLWRSYRSSILPQRQKRIAAGLKLAGFVLLAFCFLEPTWSEKSMKPGENIIVQLADNSQRMHITDPSTKQTRGERLRELLAAAEPPTWLENLQRDFQLRNYQYDSRLQRVPDFTTLNFNGEAAELASSLKLLKTQYENKPLAAIILYSDGNLTDLPEEAGWATGLPPIFPFVLGEAAPQPDAAIQQITLSETSFEDSPVTVQADVQFSLLEGHSITAQVTDVSGQLIKEQIVTVQNNEEQHTLRFQLRPTHEGVSKYALTLNVPSAAKESTRGNNTAAIAVDRGQGPYRILYVCGRPNWEYKFLRRSLADDDQIDLVGLIRMAKREPKFDFRGRTGETSNPLFRGFKDGSDEDEEQYDQSVLIRMNTKDETELIGGFPKTEEELFGFRGVIIDDLEAEFFSPDQMTLIDRFVSFRGGGLLMLGGQESFHQGNYAKTPVGKLLPVYLDRDTEAQDDQLVKLDLTREGLLQPWIRLRETEDAENTRLGKMPGFQVLNRLPAIKPGASILAQAKGPDGKAYPAVVAQRFGSGQVAAITIGDLWRWGFEDESQHEDLAQTWRQTLRWLIKDTPGMVESEIVIPERVSQPCAINITVRDEKYEPVENARVTCTINGPNGNSVLLNAQPIEAELGTYRCEYLPPGSGHYTVTIEANDSEGASIAEHQTGWSINRNLRLLRDPRANTDLLHKIANATGGEVLSTEALTDLTSKLEEREMPAMETRTRPAWHTPYFFLLALGCFIGEWAIRRKGGAA